MNDKVNKFAEVAVPLPLNQLFTYFIPPQFTQILRTGMRVVVPFGKRKLTGYVVSLLTDTNFKTPKDIDDVPDDVPSFSPEMLELGRWISNYYLSPPGETLKAMLPAGISAESERMVTLTAEFLNSPSNFSEIKSDYQYQLIQTLRDCGLISMKQLEKEIGARGLYYSVRELAKKGIINVEVALRTAKVKARYEKFARLKPEYLNEPKYQELLESLSAGAKKQRACLEYLFEKRKEVMQRSLLQSCQASSATLLPLVQNNIIEIREKEVERSFLSADDIEAPPVFTLNPDQQNALDSIFRFIDQKEFKSFLLHGVTGSGKTQIYIEALKRVIQRGQGGIVLVPEISLTPQTVRRFQSNFPGQVAVLHSRMSPGERYDSWRRVKDGTYRVVVGARSAIFAPVENLGLIVVDEEHEASYKQFETNPLYHARDVAVVRAKMNNAVVILGSATPSTESYNNAVTQKYELLSLPRRIDDIPMPEVRIVDMMREHRVYGYENTKVFSFPLKKKIAEKLEKGEQIILLQNRRGYSPYVRCRKCGHVEECIQCNITMTYHKKINRLRCHYCGHTTHVLSECPECGDKQIVFKGVGTQKVEEELNQLFPDAKIVRMDLDTTSGKRAHDRIITQFGQGKYDILLGTQMVAKGLDFHRVTLVGVISADTGLFLPDFRAAERTFQLLTQVAGRAGRKGAQGEVIIQSYSPDHPCLLLAQKHDFLNFYNREEAARKELNYPPYGRLVSILFKGKEDLKVGEAAKNFHRFLNSYSAQVDLLGPTPAPLTKVMNQYRWQIVVKSPKSTDPTGNYLRQLVKSAWRQYQQKFNDPNVKVSIDVDPMTLY